MRMMKKISSLLLALICILSISVVAFADTAYTVRLFPGDPQVGKFKTGSYQGSPGYSYQSTANFTVNAGTISIIDDKYDFIGITEAGKDYKNIGNSVKTDKFTYFPIDKTTGDVSVPVTRDQDYVVVYGIKGNLVPYTINIVSSTTGAVLRTMHYQGEIGSRPVIPLPYVENYVAPGSHGRTPTALAKGAENRWSVTYTPAPTTTGGTTTTTTVATAGGGNANANANANTATANANPNTIVQNYGPQLETIGDLETPLAEFEGPQGPTEPVLVPFVDSSGEIAQRKLPSGLTIGLIAVLAGLIAALYWYLLFYRKKKKFANEVDYDFSFLDEQDDHNDFR